MNPVDIPLALLSIAFLIALIRVAKGPTLPDRAVAAEVGLVTLVGGIALLTARLGSTHFLDVVVVATLIQFVATVSFGRLLERREHDG